MDHSCRDDWAARCREATRAPQGRHFSRPARAAIMHGCLIPAVPLRFTAGYHLSSLRDDMESDASMFEMEKSDDAQNTQLQVITDWPFPRRSLRWERCCARGS